LKAPAFLVAVALLVTLSSLWPDAVAADELKKPTARDIRIAKMVSELMQKQHLSTRKLDDEISTRAFDLFIKRLDPIKVYFNKSDIEEFSKSKNQFDDEIINGKYDTAFMIFRKFLERIDQRVAKANELIDAKHDFSVDEVLEIDPDTFDYPQDDDEATERWRKRIKYNLLLFKSEAEENKSSGKKSSEKRTPQKRLKDRYNAFSKRMHQFDNEDVIEMFISAVTMSFDPHTSYMSRATYENFLINFGLQLEGIGATLQSTDDGLTQIKRVVKGGAADKHGKMKVDDKIVAVGQGDEGEMVDITWMKLDDVVKMIRGEKGTKVRLGVLKPNDNEIKTYTIVREKIELKDSAAKGKIFEAGKKPDGTPFKIGVIDLPSFYSGMDNDSSDGKGVSTTDDMRQILEDFNKQNVDSLVLDLRQNGGGSLLESINTTGLFIDRGPVVQVKDQLGRVEVYDDNERGAVWQKPMVVMTSKFSASASEILAGAIQDYNRGIVVGDTTTHGKGTVQSLVNLSRFVFRGPDPPNYFGALKITLQQFYRPGGDSTQKRGVLSDVVLPSVTDHMDVCESDLDYPVEFDTVDPAQYSKVGQLDDQIKIKLRNNSKKRVAKSEKFQRELRRIKSYLEQKESKTISLNEEKFFARRKEFSREKEDEKVMEDQVNQKDDIKRDYYLDEVFDITVDYMKSLAQNAKDKRSAKK
jgi:carboxyl-terminal processing protease